MVQVPQVARAFLDDPIESLRRGIDNGQRVPDTATETSYALTLHARVGNKRGQIGAVHNISLRQHLTVDEEFEVDLFGRGLPRELIPQIVSGRTIQLQRYELYRASMSEIFGAPELLTLADQTGTISLRFTTKAPQPSSILGAFIRDPSSQMRVYEFIDCYIVDMGKTYSTDRVIVGAEASLIWRNLIRLQ